MAALMTADMRWTDRLAIEIAECKRMGLKVLGPDVNESFGDFGIVKGEKTIRFGLSGIKGVGKALVEEKVIPERKLNGPFKSVCDFAKRVDSTKFNKKAWESTIKTGGFDRFGTRSDILYNLENIQAYGAKMQKDAASGQTDLFGAFGTAAAVPEVEIKPAPTQYSEKEQLLWERDLLGLYISAHPLDKYDRFFEEQTHPYSSVSLENDGKNVVVGGIITSIRTILTKSNTKMAFVKIENKETEQEIIVFPNVFEEYGGKLLQDNVVKITGRVNARDKNGNVTPEVKVLMDSCEVISDDVLANYKSTGTHLEPPKEVAGGFSRRRNSTTRATKVGGDWQKKPEPEIEVTKIIEPPKDVRHEKVYILVEKPNDVELLTAIKRVCDRNLGMQDVILVLKEKDEMKALKMPFRVEASEEFIKDMKTVVGDNNVKVK
ncbi:hypothetical protein IKG20_02600, partial [Candidatus Saccharibacteria bacterium]|nr:hypothetical protein [Candidatus Saccharibacteria bacterium]